MEDNTPAGKARRHAIMNKIHTLVKCVDMNRHSEITTILIAGSFISAVGETNLSIRTARIGVLSEAMGRLGPIGMELVLLMTSMIKAEAEEEEKKHG